MCLVVAFSRLRNYWIDLNECSRYIDGLSLGEGHSSVFIPGGGGNRILRGWNRRDVLLISMQ